MLAALQKSNSPKDYSGYPVCTGPCQAFIIFLRRALGSDASLYASRATGRARFSNAPWGQSLERSTAPLHGRTRTSTSTGTFRFTQCNNQYLPVPASTVPELSQLASLYSTVLYRRTTTYHHISGVRIQDGKLSKERRIFHVRLAVVTHTRKHAQRYGIVSGRLLDAQYDPRCCQMPVQT